MITIRLLGGARKALGGKSSVQFEKSSGTVSEILGFLQNAASDAHLLNPSNLIIAVNGTDSAALKGPSTEVKNGDVVTVVTVVHGGSYVLNGQIHVSITAAKKFDIADINEFLNKLRMDNSGISIQALNAESVYGVEHILGVIPIVVEARKRGIMIANKIEAELLLRLACTKQIAEAIASVGLKKGAPCCIVGFSEQGRSVDRLGDTLAAMMKPDNSVILPTTNKKRVIAKRMGLDPKKLVDQDMLNHLIESAAVMVK